MGSPVKHGLASVTTRMGNPYPDFAAPNRRGGPQAQRWHRRMACRTTSCRCSGQGGHRREHQSGIGFQRCRPVSLAGLNREECLPEETCSRPSRMLMDRPSPQQSRIERRGEGIGAGRRLNGPLRDSFGAAGRVRPPQGAELVRAPVSNAKRRLTGPEAASGAWRSASPQADRGSLDRTAATRYSSATCHREHLPHSKPG